MDTIYLTFVLLILATSLISLLFWYKFIKRKKNLNSLRLEWGQDHKKYRNLELIDLYFRSISNKTERNILSDRTWHDLDMDDIFCILDRTNSKIGQQFLYNLLRDQERSNDKLHSFDQLVEHYLKFPNERVNTQYAISKLNNDSLYFYHILFIGKIPTRPKHFIIYPLLSLLTLLSIIGIIFEPIFIWPLLLSLSICISLHYYNKVHVGSYIDSFHNIRRIIKTVKKIKQIQKQPGEEFNLKTSIRNCQQIASKTNWISDYKGSGNEMLDLIFVVLELIKGIFLLEPLLFYSALSKIKKYKTNLKELFEFIGLHDAALSVASFRTGFPVTAKPIFIDSNIGIEVINLIHPLIHNCVPNSIETGGKGVLITGSNMAGKSTFIKSIGISAVLSQSIFTTTAEKYIAPRFNVCSSINIMDNIKENISYYMEEVNVIRELITESKLVKCLFILDELFKGTNTFDRLAAAKAVLSYLQNGNNLVFISTHDVELTELLDNKYKLYYFQDEIIEGNLKFNYCLKKGIPTKSNAIKLLEIANFPKEILEEAIQFKKELK